jgi:hypothetical protein
MVGAKPDGQLQDRNVDGARMAYVSGILFVEEYSPDEIGTAVAKPVKLMRIIATWIANPAR